MTKGRSIKILPCMNCGKKECDNQGCACWNCGSKRKERLKRGYYKGKEYIYCSETCANELLNVLRNPPPLTSTNISQKHTDTISPPQIVVIMRQKRLEYQAKGYNFAKRTFQLVDDGEISLETAKDAFLFVFLYSDFKYHRAYCNGMMEVIRARGIALRQIIRK